MKGYVSWPGRTVGGHIKKRLGTTGMHQRSRLEPHGSFLHQYYLVWSGFQSCISPLPHRHATFPCGVSILLTDHTHTHRAFLYTCSGLARLGLTWHSSSSAAGIWISTITGLEGVSFSDDELVLCVKCLEVVGSSRLWHKRSAIKRRIFLPCFTIIQHCR